VLHTSCVDSDRSLSLYITRKPLCSPQVENAQLLLETQLGYISKHKQLRANEDQMRQRLMDIEASYAYGQPRRTNARDEGERWL
jgi:hypothetical protein